MSWHGTHPGEGKGIQFKQLLPPFKFSLFAFTTLWVWFLSSVLFFSPTYILKTRHVQDNISPRILQSVLSPHPQLAHPILPSAMTSHVLPLWQGKNIIGFTRFIEWTWFPDETWFLHLLALVRKNLKEHLLLQWIEEENVFRSTQ